MRLPGGYSFTITKVELQLSVLLCPDFPRRFGKRVKAAGGSYSSCRGHDHRRYVHLPLPGNEVLFNTLVCEQQNGCTVVVRGLEHNIANRRSDSIPVNVVAATRVHKIPCGPDPSAVLDNRVLEGMQRVIRDLGDDAIVQDSAEHRELQRTRRVAWLRKQIRLAEENVTLWKYDLEKLERGGL